MTATEFIADTYKQGAERKAQAKTTAEKIEALEWWAKKHERLAEILEAEHGDERLARSARKTARIAREEAQALAN